MEIKVNTAKKYSIHVEYHNFHKLRDYFNFTNSQVAFIVDAKLYDKVAKNYSEYLIFPLNLDNEKKDFTSYQKIIHLLKQHNFNRDDLIVNVGGGTISDLGAFVASTYKRGISYINVPTTTLAQIDAGVGGKNGLDVFAVKNLVGTISQPLGVVIDFDFLDNLPIRQYHNGLYEALKMALLFEPRIIELIEDNYLTENIKEITTSLLFHKVKIVEKDETDKNERKVLNFGHTVGHCLEDDNLLHGEAVMHGMLTMIDNDDIINRLKNLATRWNLPILPLLDYNHISTLLLNDKKASAEYFSCIVLKDYKKWSFERLTLDDIIKRIQHYEQSNR